MVYDHQGRLTSRRPPGGSETEGFAYDVEDQLKQVRRSEAVAEILEYDPLGAVMFRKVGTRAYWYVGPFATVTADVSASCLGYGCSPSTTPKVRVHVQLAGIRIATVRAPPSGSTADPSGDVLYYHRDQRGSVVATTLSGGTVGVKYRYGPYGQLDREEVVDATGESELGFTGGLRLGWTPGSQSGSLLLLGARVYHAELRRWVQADTVEAARYTYAAGDPVSLMDPTGRMAVYVEGMYIGEDDGQWMEQAARFYSWNLGFPRRYFTTDPRIKYFSTVVAVVSVDPGTGKVTVLRYQFGLETQAPSSTPSSTYTPSESLLQTWDFAGQLRLDRDFTLVTSDPRAGQPFLYWVQDAGNWFIADDAMSGVVAAGRGYSGKRGGLNNSDWESVLSKGPVPTGDYMLGDWMHAANGAPTNYSIPLVPDSGTYWRIVELGRDPNSFYIHGGYGPNDPTASKGCPIIEPASVRIQIINYGVRELRVIRSSQLAP